MQKRSSHWVPSYLDERDGATSRYALTRLMEAIGGGVYAVKAPDGTIKIGYTGNLKNRLSGLGGFKNILALDLCGTWDDEQAIHARLEGLSIKGREWYPPCDEVLGEVNTMRDRLSLPLLTLRDIQEHPPARLVG